MKFSYLMAAVVALSAGAAQAQSVIHLSGASASRTNVVLALKAICGGTFSVLKDSSSTSSLGNIFTAKCSVPYTGTGVTESEVRMNVSGGSLNAYLVSTAGSATALTYIDGATVGCNPLTGSGVLSTITNLFYCAPPLGATVPTRSAGGYLDVEGAIYKAAGLLPATVPDSHFVASAFQQTFGVAVSGLLYNAMQEHQTAKGRLPANCAPQVAGVFTASGIATPDCQPSVSRADMAAMMVNGNNQAKRTGANWLIGGRDAVANDLGALVIATAMPSKTNFHLHRRVDTSGTQASSNLYFLTNPTGGGAAGGTVAPVGNGAGGTTTVGATFSVTAHSGSGDVVSALNSAAATNFSAGFLSLENNPIGSAANTYRFVKVNGQHGSEGVSGASQTAEAIAGRYDVWFETFKYCIGGVCPPVLNAIDAAVVVGAGSPGIFRSAESGFTRGGRSTRPITTKATF